MITMERTNNCIAVIGEHSDAEVYKAASGDFCCKLTEYGKEDLTFNLNTTNPAEAVHVVRGLLNGEYSW